MSRFLQRDTVLGQQRRQCHGEALAAQVVLGSEKRDPARLSTLRIFADASRDVIICDVGKRGRLLFFVGSPLTDPIFKDRRL